MSRFKKKLTWDLINEAERKYGIDKNWQKELSPYQYEKTNDHSTHKGYVVCNSGHEWVCLACGQSGKTTEGLEQIELDKLEDAKQKQAELDYINKELAVMTEGQKHRLLHTMSEYSSNRQSHDYYMSVTFSQQELKEIKEKAQTPYRTAIHVVHQRRF